MTAPNPCSAPLSSWYCIYLGVLNVQSPLPPPPSPAPDRPTAILGQLDCRQLGAWGPVRPRTFPMEASGSPCV